MISFSPIIGSVFEKINAKDAKETTKEVLSEIAFLLRLLRFFLFFRFGCQINNSDLMRMLTIVK